MPYDPYNDRSYQHIDEQLGFPHQTNGHRAKQQLPRRDFIADAEARRQAAEREARLRNQQRNSRVSPDASQHPRQQPMRQEDFVEEEAYDDEELYTRAPRSAIKYQPIDPYLNNIKQAMGATYKPGSPPPPNRHAIPPRRNAQYQQEQTPQRGRNEDTMRYKDEVYTEEIEEVRPRRRLKPHWLVFAGIALLLMIAGWIGFNDFSNWWQTHTDDTTFGNPRTFQIDAVVGHGDSDSNPSHFIALNLKGDIIVIEIPGGNVKKMISYPITTLPGNQGNPPVRLVFQDFDHDGRIDLLVQIGDPPTTITYMLFNNGTQFVGKS